MTASERKLLYRLAVAYSFIKQLHDEAAIIGDRPLASRTEGINASIAAVKREYPNSFQRELTRVRKYIDKQAEQKAITAQELSSKETNVATIPPPSLSPDLPTDD